MKLTFDGPLDLRVRAGFGKVTLAVGSGSKEITNITIPVELVPRLIEALAAVVTERVTETDSSSI